MKVARWCLAAVLLSRAASPALSAEVGTAPAPSGSASAPAGLASTCRTAPRDAFPTPTAMAKTCFTDFRVSPFPYQGTVPGSETRDFLDRNSGGRLGHSSPRGGVYWQDETYGSKQVLLHVPRGFDPKQPALIVVFLHGNQVRLKRDVQDRQRVPQQVAESGLNAVLVAPQFAVDALDSSAGRFWEPGMLASFLDEAAERLAELYGDRRVEEKFQKAPVVLVAYSGGYLPAAWALHRGGAADRLSGVVLLDALYGEADKFADWIVRRPRSFFLSAYSTSTRAQNAALRRLLTERGVPVESGPLPRLKPGTVAFLDAGSAAHNDFVTQAWVRDPLKAVLASIAGYSRTPVAARSRPEPDGPGNRLPKAANGREAAPPHGSCKEPCDTERPGR